MDALEVLPSLELRDGDEAPEGAQLSVRHRHADALKESRAASLVRVGRKGERGPAQDLHCRGTRSSGRSMG